MIRRLVRSSAPQLPCRLPATSSRQTGLSPNGLAILNTYPAPIPGSSVAPRTGLHRRPTRSINGREPERRYSAEREKPHRISPHGLLVFGVPAVRSGLGLDAEILQPSEPDQHGRLDLDDQPDHDQRSPRHDEPGRRLYSGKQRRSPASIALHSASIFRTFFRRAKISTAKYRPSPFPTSTPRRRTVSFAFDRPDLYDIG